MAATPRRHRRPSLLLRVLDWLYLDPFRPSRRDRRMLPDMPMLSTVGYQPRHLAVS